MQLVYDDRLTAFIDPLKIHLILIMQHLEFIGQEMLEKMLGCRLLELFV